MREEGFRPHISGYVDYKASIDPHRQNLRNKIDSYLDLHAPGHLRLKKMFDQIEIPILVHSIHKRLYRQHHPVLFVVENQLWTEASSKYGIYGKSVFTDGQKSFSCTGLQYLVPSSEESSGRIAKPDGIGRKISRWDRYARCLQSELIFTAAKIAKFLFQTPKKQDFCSKESING